MRKIFWGFIITVWATVAMIKLNYEIALHQASKVDTDGEIEAVMQSYGFTGDINAPITESDKFNALVVTIFGNE
jgi:hypothetical protein